MSKKRARTVLTDLPVELVDLCFRAARTPSVLCLSKQLNACLGTVRLARLRQPLLSAHGDRALGQRLDVYWSAASSYAVSKIICM